MISLDGLLDDDLVGHLHDFLDVHGHFDHNLFLLLALMHAFIKCFHRFKFNSNHQKFTNKRGLGFGVWGLGFGRETDLLTWTF